MFIYTHVYRLAFSNKPIPFFSYLALLLQSVTLSLSNFYFSPCCRICVSFQFRLHPFFSCSTCSPCRIVTSARVYFTLAVFGRTRNRHDPIVDPSFHRDKLLKFEFVNLFDLCVQFGTCLSSSFPLALPFLIAPPPNNPYHLDHFYFSSGRNANSCKLAQTFNLFTCSLSPNDLRPTTCLLLLL